jgi:hypothetical protein
VLNILVKNARFPSAFCSTLYRQDNVALPVHHFCTVPVIGHILALQAKAGQTACKNGLFALLVPGLPEAHRL